MKLSAFLAASLPVFALSQMPAIAQNDGADSNNWLKESLATLKTPKQATTKSSKSSSAKSSAAFNKKVSHAAPASNGATMRLRPFMPNRFLPRESDLHQGMVAQAGKFDYSVDSSHNGSNSSGAMTPRAGLSGQVNESYNSSPRPRSIYDQYSSAQNSFVSVASAMRKLTAPRSGAGTRSPRVVANQPRMMPEQMARVAAMLSGSGRFPEPPTASRTAAPPQLQVSMPMAAALPRMAQRTIQQIQQHQPSMVDLQQFCQQEFSPEQQAQLGQMMEMNKPTARMGPNGEIVAMQPDPSGGGQFPISPMAALQSSHRPSDAPQARFGSWHDRSQLPDSGFHSYIAFRKPTVLEFSSPVSPVNKINSNSNSKAHGKNAKGKKTASSKSLAQASSLKSAPILATYPPYARSTSNSY